MKLAFYHRIALGRSEHDLDLKSWLARSIDDPVHFRSNWKSWLDRSLLLKGVEPRTAVGRGTGREDGDSALKERQGSGLVSPCCPVVYWVALGVLPPLFQLTNFRAP